MMLHIEQVCRVFSNLEKENCEKNVHSIDCDEFQKC